MSENETAVEGVEPVCPKCGGAMWDNRLTKRNPKAPDYKCKDGTCDGVIWPPRVYAGPTCPECGGEMWDNRENKKNPKAPDYKCKKAPRMGSTDGCQGVIWPPRDGAAAGSGATGGAGASRPKASPAKAAAKTAARSPAASPAPTGWVAPGTMAEEEEDLPF